MRSKIVILVSLAGFASPLWAEEIQWRSATPRAEQPAAGSPTRAVSMARPMPLPMAEPNGGDPGVTPVSFRPVPVARTRGEEVRYASPLPQGPAIAGTAQGGVAQGGKPLPNDKQERIEEVPIAPTPLPPSPDGSRLIVPLDDGGIVMPEGDGVGGLPFFLGGVSPRNFFYASAEYMLWTIRQDDMTPLLATGNLNVLGNTVVYGKDQLANPARNGGRFGLGCWLPFYPDCGVEVIGMFLGQRSASFGTNGNLTVPSQGSTFNLGPNGSFAAASTSELWGLEANFRYKWYQGPLFWVDCIAGYRHLSLNESLAVYNQFGNSSNHTPSTISYRDQFATTNGFNGLQSGAEFNWNFWRFFTVGGHAKLGLGNVTQTLNISGISNPEAGGLHAKSSNNYTRNEFAVMPDVGVKAGWNATEHLKIYVGYDFIYLSSVMRVGEQINTQSSKPTLHQSEFWAHGVNVGLVYSW